LCLQNKRLDRIMGKKKMTVEEAGRKGGKRTLQRHGVEHFRSIGRKPKGRKKSG